MDDSGFHSNVTVRAPSESAMELDYMDELLLEGCWLETIDGSTFFNQTPSTSNSFFESPYPWSSLEASYTSVHDTREDGSMIESQETGLVNRSSCQSLVSGFSESDQCEKLFADNSELNKLFWIKPRLNHTVSSVMDRLFRAITYIKDSQRGRETLIQIWVPVEKGGTRVLTTIDQPFSLNSSSAQLANYRNISLNYQFAAEQDSGLSVGLPGRVFLGKVPEWSPDVRFFRVDEYPRVPYAQQCDVRGTIALPVFEQGSKQCLGVLEVVMTTQKVNYRSELESVCKALEAVHLRSSESLNPQKTKECTSSYQVALPEILDVLKSACGSHGLPLAQTWVPCILQGKEGCRHSDENLALCVSTIDSACFIADPGMRGFQEACSEHHLFKGEGVAGKAFLTNQPCFSPDITSYSKTEYPLSHHARMFGLCASVAIRLRSVYTGTSDFVLEFFLPTGCRDPEVQKSTLSSLSIIIQRVCRSLRVVTDKELKEEALMLDNNATVGLDSSLQVKTKSADENTRSGSSSQEESCGNGATQDDKGKGVIAEKPLTGLQQEFNVKSSPGSGEYSIVGGSLSTAGKSGDKKRAKAEKTITLDVLRQHFAGSLKDAAKNIGVCPTTLKRICRQHGIKRWPSRKIKKVGHSLQKLQVVIDSVQGASGAFQIGSFYTNFPDLASPNTTSGTSPFLTGHQFHAPQSTGLEPDGVGPVSPRSATSKSPSSSCSQSSSSSQFCSSGTHQQPSTWNVSGSEDPHGGVTSNEGSLKRARSEAELQIPYQEPTSLISGSLSQRSLVEQYNPDTRPPLPKNVGQLTQEADFWRVKVSYGEEKIRFRMLKSWRFKDLVQEVVRRFNIGDMGGFHIKYLDDDSEWVLLTCDADLEECIDICRSSQRQTIKLCLQVSHTHSRSSVGSNSHL
ncbi:hypothetical protein RND81_01G112700 [Saponaria officinalis]|uniref:Uncharacterized protein n=1 Tax=Saponaria officinalis TaxID=3572 RepID=A0AAW1NES1_SAPOF